MEINQSTLSVLIFFVILDILMAENSTNYQPAEGNQTRILSRRKRFLTFPEGSSFQLVFETQNHGYLQIGDVVWFSNTAALAWELPSDPKLFNMFKSLEKGDPGLRRQDTKHIIYLNEDGKVISTVPYQRKKIIVNPAFGKRSVDEPIRARVEARTFSVKELHATNQNRSNLYHLDEYSIELHQQGRRSLYAKLETFFEALGWQGKNCILRLLCENGRRQDNQGTLMEEIMRATFTFPNTPSSLKSSTNSIEDYETAHRSRGDCSQLYPECHDLHGKLLFDNKSFQ